MALCLVRSCDSLTKFGQFFNCSSNVGYIRSPWMSSVCFGVRLHLFRSSSGQRKGQTFSKVTCGTRPTCNSLAICFRSHGPWQNKHRTSCDNSTCVFSTCGSANYGKDMPDHEVRGRVRQRIVQTQQKIRETGEKVKEKMEDFAVRRENILTIPNLLCGTRIVLSPILGYLVVQKSFECALGVFLVAGLTDLLDGFIARNFKNQQSTFGSFLDPLADKFLVFCLVLSLTCSQLLPVPLTVLIIARDACLIGASAYVRYLSLPLPKTWSSYFDVTHATARLSPTLISKYNTFVQLMLVACTLASPVFHLENHPFLPVLWYITATTTVASALSYVFSKNTYHILKDLKDKKVAFRLSDRVFDIKRKFDVVVDLGCHKGQVGQFLTDDVVGVLYNCDASVENLKRVKPPMNVPHVPLLVDEEHLPFLDNSTDLVLSNLSLHWVNNLPGTFRQIHNTLKNDGVFLGTMFGGDTLFELRCALQLAETEREGGFAAHVSPFTDVQDVGHLMHRAGFTMLTVDIDEIKVNYPSMMEVMWDVKGMGESNAAWNRKSHLHRDTIKAAVSIYKEMYGNSDGTVPATYQIIYMIGWKPDPSQPKAAARGSATVSLKDLSNVGKIIKERADSFDEKDK